mgnify:CR=1 FL=1
MNFFIGDQVIFINENLRGKVVNIKGDFLVVTCSDLDLEIHQSEVIKVSKDVEYIYSKLIKNESSLTCNNDELSQNEDTKSSIIDLKVHISKNFELDLHIEKLIENFEFLNTQEILQFQMNAFFRGIFKAKRLGIDYLIVIHGIGKGILKRKIIHFLEKNEAVFCEAEYMLYKGGAVEIKIN